MTGTRIFHPSRVADERLKSGDPAVIKLALLRPVILRPWLSAGLPFADSLRLLLLRMAGYKLVVLVTILFRAIANNATADFELCQIIYKPILHIHFKT